MADGEDCEAIASRFLDGGDMPGKPMSRVSDITQPMEGEEHYINCDCSKYTERSIDPAEWKRLVEFEEEMLNWQKPGFHDEDDKELFGKQCAALWEARYYLGAVKVDFDDAYELEDFVNAPKVNEPATCTTSRPPAKDLEQLQDLQNSDAAYEEEKRAKAKRQARIAASATEFAEGRLSRNLRRRGKEY